MPKLVPNRRIPILGPVAAAVTLATAASAQMFPVAVTGFNRDIVVEAGASVPYSGAASTFDVNNGWAFYEQGLPASVKGLPVGGTFTTVVDPSIEVRLEPYTANNALLLDSGTPSGTLSFAPAAQVPYGSIAIVASSANGGGVGTLVITFTDASTSASINFNAQDWFNNTANNARNNLGRVNLNTNAVDDASAGNPRLYLTSINLAGLGLSTRSIASITFTKPAASNTTVVMAVSGARAVTSLTPVAATGWNRDIVVEAGAAIPYSDFAAPFDTFNNIAWYEQGLPGSTKGLPPGGGFTSLADAAIAGQFEPYNAPNALFLDVPSPTGTLTLAPISQRPYEFLAVFAASSNQGGLGSVVVTFADATTLGPLSFNAQDWFNVTTNNALNNLGRQGLAAATADDGSAGNPRIYQTVIDLVSRGLSTRTVVSLTFTKPSVGGASQNTAVMAISGQVSPGNTGSCTYPDGTCANLPQANCTGSYGGDGSTCPPTGACIAANGDCTLRFQANCGFVMGMYLGDNVACPAPGGCISANGDCTQRNSFQCAADGGMFLGAGSACPAPGGCCTSSGCVLRNSFQCAVIGGNFQGAGTTCDLSYPAGIVSDAAAFEDISGTGTEITAWTGSSDDGNASVPIGFDFPFFNSTYSTAFVGTNGLITFVAGSNDFSNDCPAPNALTPNNAIFPMWDDFHVGTETFLHPGRVYTQTLASPDRFIVQWNRVGQYNAGQVPTDENTFQAILYPDGDIEFRYGPITAQAACDATVGIENSAGTTGLNYDHTLLGTGNTALAIGAMPPCPQQPGGVCCRGGTCNTSVSEAQCNPGGAAGAAFVASATMCNAGGVPGSPCCYADYNKQGGVTVQDIFDFLADYFTGNPFARIGSDGDSGAPTVQSIFDFLAAYFSGSC